MRAVKSENIDVMIWLSAEVRALEMVEQQDPNIAIRIVEQNLNEESSVIKSNQGITSTIISFPNDPVYCDELISALSVAYENKRACQVSEWERSQREQIQTTA
jgi:hypothetical protein